MYILCHWKKLVDIELSITPSYILELTSNNGDHLERTALSVGKMDDVL